MLQAVFLDGFFKAMEKLSAADLPDMQNLATIPEHSLPLMQAMGAGEAFVERDFLFFHAENWLTAIGYPLAGAAKNKDFQEALKSASEKTNPREIFAIAPALSPALASKLLESDRFYVLSAKAQVPARLRNPLKKALLDLEISETCFFSPEHRRLWAEFLGGRASKMTSRVAELYAHTPQALTKAQGSLRLLNAWDQRGHLVACLLLDYWPANFLSYILGAHSKSHYYPHAMDALFAVMLQNAQKADKLFIHLGLGVNDGILRFKEKWGAIPSWRYNMAHWQMDNAPFQEEEPHLATAVCLAILRSGDQSARQMLESSSSAKPFAMLWQVKKNGKISWLGGTAHFFCHSFEPSFRKLFAKTENIIFEGPLDDDFMAKVNESGRNRPADQTPLLDLLTAAEVDRLEKTVLGPRGFLAKSLGLTSNIRLDVRHLLATGRPWYVFFTLWTTFLERLGWHDSVDMEAWKIAVDMGKNVVGMESLDEQLESLQSLPVERALRFFRDCGSWKRRARRNMTAYLSGDLEKMMGSSAEFPTRTEHIVGRRDQRFRERMRRWLEKGDSAVFVGSAHVVNLRYMLEEDGFEVKQLPFGIFPKIHLNWRKLSRPDGNARW